MCCWMQIAEEKDEKFFHLFIMRKLKEKYEKGQTPWTWTHRGAMLKIVQKSFRSLL